MTRFTERDRVEGRWLLGSALVGVLTLGFALVAVDPGGFGPTFDLSLGAILGGQIGVVTLPVARRLHPLPKCPVCGRLLP